MKNYLSVLKSITIAAILTMAFSATFANSQEVALSFEETHKDKDYIVLLSDSEVVLSEAYTFKTRKHKKIKIQKEGGKDLGEMIIYYNRARESIVEVEAFSVTPDGKKKLAPAYFLINQPGYSVFSSSSARLFLYSLPPTNFFISCTSPDFSACV